MTIYTQDELAYELALLLPADEYDLPAILSAYQDRYGITRLSETGDAYADIAIDHQITREPDPLAGMREALHTLPAGETYVWEYRGVEIAIYGQARSADAPTPGARITVAGERVTPDTWADLLALADEAADTRDARENRLWTALDAEHRAVARAEIALTGVRATRDRTIIALAQSGVTPYRIAKRLGIAQTTVAAILRKHTA